MNELEVYLCGRLAGRLRQDATGYLAYAYEPSYAGDPASRPLSMSLPLRLEEFTERECQPFFAGLLPDSDLVRKTLAERFAIDRGDDFGLLSNLGRDCAGAVVLMRPQSGPPSESADRWIEPLDAPALAALIEGLPERPLFAEEGDIMLSLAGVHDKAAVYVDRDGTVHLPHKGFPSTHILKVDIKFLPNSIRTEFFCLKVAKDMGLPAPAVTLGAAEGHIYMLVARYDRAIRLDAERRLLDIERLHQEDFCQASGVLPRIKYEKQGGPGLATMFRLLKRASTNPAREVGKLLGYAMFNFLIGNPDSHAKNYSLLYHAATTELAPIYDVNNAAAFRSHYKQQVPRLAQSVGGQRDPTQLTKVHWNAMAAEVGLNPRLVRSRLADMARMLPVRVHARRAKLLGSLADCPELDLIAADVEERCARVLADLAKPAEDLPAS